MARSDDSVGGTIAEGARAGSDGTDLPLSADVLAFVRENPDALEKLIRYAEANGYEYAASAAREARAYLADQSDDASDGDSP